MKNAKRLGWYYIRLYFKKRDLTEVGLWHELVQASKAMLIWRKQMVSRYSRQSLRLTGERRLKLL